MKIRIRFFIMAAIIILTNCKNSERMEDKFESNDSSKKPLDERVPSPNDTTLISGKEVSQLLLRVVKIENRVVITDSSSEYQNKCLKWKLSEEQIIQIFRMSMKISGSEMHDLYYDLPCRITGQILINKKLFNFIINGGSFAYVFNSIENFYLGCSGERCKKYFIVQGGNQQRDVPNY